MTFGSFFRVVSSCLQELSLRECLGSTTKLPDSVASLSSLRVFRLCSKALRSLPDQICQLSALQELYLDCPLLQQLPENFGRLATLEHLSFTDCTEMRRLPDSLGDLSSLTSLYIDGSWHVDQFPPRVGALQQMRRLELQNFEGGFPEACKQWAKLEQSLPRDLPSAFALRHLTLNDLGPTMSLEPLCQLVSLERLEVSCVNEEERFPKALFALPSLAHVEVGYVRWLDPLNVATMQNSKELAALLECPARNHCCAAAAAAAAPAVGTGAAAAAGAAGNSTHHTALGPSLKHLTICLGIPADVRRGGILSARLCSLLSLTHLHIDGLSSIILPLDLSSLHNLRSLSLTSIWLCLPHSLTRLAPCLHSLKLHYSSSKDADAFCRKLPSFLTSLTSLTNLHLRNMYLPSCLCAHARPPYAAHRV
ncbi:unnamed protein product [Closterium sp. NIES-54]